MWEIEVKPIGFIRSRVITLSIVHGSCIFERVRNMSDSWSPNADNLRRLFIGVQSPSMILKYFATES